MLYKEEIEFLKKVEDHSDEANKRNLLPSYKLELIKNKHPEVSNEYITYLAEIGEGAFRECQFAVEEDLYDMSDIKLEKVYKVKDGVKFFGHNFSGDFSGFDFEKADGFVVEFWHDSNELYYTNKTFKQYIREQMLMDSEGNDLRLKR